MSLEPIVILEGACVCLVVAQVSWPVPSLSTVPGPSHRDGWRPRLPVFTPDAVLPVHSPGSYLHSIQRAEDLEMSFYGTQWLLHVNSHHVRF